MCLRRPHAALQLHETTAEGAKRETWEEAGARVEVEAPFAHFDIPTIGQVGAQGLGRLRDDAKGGRARPRC